LDWIILNEPLVHKESEGCLGGKYNFKREDDIWPKAFERYEVPVENGKEK
jgi:hypothetical protein